MINPMVIVTWMIVRCECVCKCLKAFILVDAVKAIRVKMIEYIHNMLNRVLVSLCALQ